MVSLKDNLMEIGQHALEVLSFPCHDLPLKSTYGCIHAITVTQNLR